MGLQDLLAVVLGVKTAEYLDQRRAAKAAAYPRTALETVRARMMAERVQSIEDLVQSIEDVINDELGVALAARDPDSMASWAVTGQKRLRTYRQEMQSVRQQMVELTRKEPFWDALLGEYDDALECYMIAMASVAIREPGGLDQVRAAADRWRRVQSILSDPSLINTPRPPFPSSSAARVASPAPEAPGSETSTAIPTDTKICPECAEEVKAAALICRHCRHEFNKRQPSFFDQILAEEMRRAGIPWDGE